jgi:ADP-ribose pyrophosphatase YjhB (NUDIX family)
MGKGTALHCTYCGVAFSPDQQGWPRTCAACGQISYRNPLPVVVVLLPVRDRGGLLVIRRAVADDPGFGQLALPGGYIDINDASWQHAAARELREETGIVLPPEAFTEFGVRSAPNGTLLIFTLACAIDSPALPARFMSTGETSEMSVITRPQPLAFDLHTQAACRWFGEHGGARVD